MSDELEKRLAFLRERDVQEREHSERGLLAHLLGTRRLLLEWGARPALCDAGLFHSVYGTEGYRHAAVPLAMRPRVMELIGEEAEAVMWLFCVMRRETLGGNVGRREDMAVAHRLTGERLPLADGQFDDLVNLTFANELEAYPRMHRTWRRGCRTYLRELRPAAMPGAGGAFDALCPRWWEFWN